MKKRLLIGAAACTVLLAFAGCQSTSQHQEPQNDNSNPSGQGTITDVIVQSEGSSEVSADTTDVAPSVEDGDAPTIQEAQTIIAALNRIDLIGAGALTFDSDSEYTDADGNIYHKVTDSEFGSTADLREYMNTYLTQEMIEERYLGILDGEQPMCIDVEDELYIKYASRGGGFAFSDIEPVIEKSSEDGYSILTEYDNYGALETMDIGVRKEDGVYKIYNIVFGN